MCEGLTQTQERKLFRELTLGKEQTVSWHKLLDVFATLPDNRQRTALKKLDLNHFLTLVYNVQEAEKDRTVEIEAQAEKKKKIAEFKKQMAESGLSLSDLGGIGDAIAEDKPKRKYGKRVGSGQPTGREGEILSYLVSIADETKTVRGYRGIDIADDLGITQTAFNNRLSKLKKKGFIEGGTREGIKILKEADESE